MKLIAAKARALRVKTLAITADVADMNSVKLLLKKQLLNLVP
jgi:hypothetical protein